MWLQGREEPGVESIHWWSDYSDMILLLKGILYSDFDLGLKVKQLTECKVTQALASAELIFFFYIYTNRTRYHTKVFYLYIMLKI